MKLYLTTLLFGLLTVSQVGAQNWQPFKPGESFHYKHNATFPERTVRIDSATNHGGDSIWHFNRLFVDQGNGTAIINGPNLGGRSLRIQGNGRFQFWDPENITLDTWAHLGDTCLRDSLHPNIYGVIRRELVDSVLGELDSLKVVSIGTDSLVVSKGHGVVAWPAAIGGTPFELIGIQERNIGIVLPGFDDYFNFQVGDIYYWIHGKAFWGGYPEYGLIYRQKMTITAVAYDSIGLHVDYHLMTRRDSLHPGYFTTFSQSDENWVIKDDGVGIIANTPVEPVRFVNSLKNFLPPFLKNMDMNGAGLSPYNSNPYRYWSAAVFFKQDDLIRLRLLPDSAGFAQIYFTLNTGGAICGVMPFGRQKAVFTPGLGLDSCASEGPMRRSFAYIVGHIINGDTVGTIYDESYLLGTDARQSNLQWAIFPNPANEGITLLMPAEGKGNLRILDLMGHEVRRSASVTNGDEINLLDLAAGMYLVEIRTRSARSTKRLQIVR